MRREFERGSDGRRHVASVAERWSTVVRGVAGTWNVLGLDRLAIQCESVSRSSLGRGKHHRDAMAPPSGAIECQQGSCGPLELRRTARSMRAPSRSLARQVEPTQD